MKRIYHRARVLFLTTAIAYSVLPLSAQDAAVRGRVLDESNAAVSNALVAAVPIAAGAPHQAISGPDGSFQVTGVKPGNYRICAAAPETDLLPNCQWEEMSSPTALAAGQQVSNLSIRLQRGKTIEIQVDDPVQLLAGASRAGGPAILAGVWDAKGIFHRASPRAAESGVRKYLARSSTSNRPA
jgi:hypothetical protein